VAEDPNVFGPRVQLVLDGRPVWGGLRHAALLAAVLGRYRWAFLGTHHRPAYSYLIDDVLRYWRSLCVAVRWDFDRDRGGWYWRQAKLWHSRLVMCAGLLFVLGEADRDDADIGWVLARLEMTPLERLAWVYEANGDPHFERIAGAYERFLTLAHDPGRRAELARAAPGAPDEVEVHRPAWYGEVEESAWTVRRELVRFALEGRHGWNSQFVTQLLF
jgi:hypothetical protein